MLSWWTLESAWKQMWTYLWRNIKIYWDGRPTLNTVITIPQAGVLDWMKRRKWTEKQQLSLFPECGCSWTSCFMLLLTLFDILGCTLKLWANINHSFSLKSSLLVIFLEQQKQYLKHCSLDSILLSNGFYIFMLRFEYLLFSPHSHFCGYGNLTYFYPQLFCLYY